MKSGSVWGLGEREGSLALFPLEHGKYTILKGVFGFDSEFEALHWIEETAKLSEQGARLVERVKPHLADELQ